jgi:segregation and condensation protein A
MKRMAYELTRQYFQGPVEKLLGLIEEKKLEITELSLADVTADFLNYIKTLEQNKAGQQIVADFLVVATRLVLIKSKALLPSLELSEEEAEDIRDLETRLKVYQEMKRTQGYIRERWNEAPQMYSREFFMTHEPLFYPPTKMAPDMLRNALARMVGELEKILKPLGTVKREILQLKEKIEEILLKLTTTPLNMTRLQIGKGRDELVVLFLAVLHLIKDQFVNVVQDTHFGEITIAKKGQVE